MKYYYIHGLKSNGRFSSNKLREVLQSDVELLDWKDEIFYHYNMEILHKQLKDKEDYILIGSSLGGFYAMQLANTFSVPCVLFNPVIYPKKSFEKVKDKYNINEDIVNSYPDKPDKQILIPRLIVVGKNDEILDPNDAINYWNNKCNLLITEDKHHIENFKPFKQVIEHLSTPLYYDINECV